MNQGEKKKIGWLANWGMFLFDIKKPFLEYLRNLTPIILFFAIGLYLWHINEFLLFTFNLNNWWDTGITFGAFIISFLALGLNVIGFIEETFKSIRQLNDYEEKRRRLGKRLAFLETMKILCKSNFGKEIIVFYLIFFVSIIVISVASVSMFNGFVQHL